MQGIEHVMRLECVYTEDYNVNITSPSGPTLLVVGKLLDNVLRFLWAVVSFELVLFNPPKRLCIEDYYSLSFVEYCS